MTTHEGEFIRFCQRVASFHSPAPFWARNLNMFNTVFTKYKDGENISKPVKDFVDTHRETLEKPLFVGDDLNDEWLAIPEDVPAPTPRKAWSTCCPRGVYLPMKEGDHTAVLPLSEVYATCIEIAESDRRSFHGVDVKCVVVQFFQYFFAMLHEVEPENTHFKESVETAEGLVGSSKPGGELGDLGSMVRGTMEGLLSQVPDENKEMLEGTVDALTKGDFAKVFESVGPMMQQFMPMFQNMSSQMNKSHASVEETPDVPMIEPEEQD